jgi:hypothetical protein
MKKLREECGFTIAVHTGLVDDELAEGFLNAGIDSAMIDIIGDERTVREIYRISAGVDSFENSLHALERFGIPTSPHIVAGLHYGKFLGERTALDMISGCSNIASLVIVVFTPLPHTEMADVQPPEPHEVAAFLAEARVRFPSTLLLLGCAHPYGDHAVRTERYAIDAGVNGIAYPTDETIARAKHAGLTPHYSELCCSLIFHEMHGRETR